jgi:type II secretory pathway component PulF
VSDVFHATGLFSPSQVSLLTTAEETGTLEEALGQLAQRTREERENFLKATQWGGCATAFILAAVATFFAAVAGWTTVYSEIYKVFESPSWSP